MAKYDPRQIVVASIILQGGSYALFGAMSSVWGWYLLSIPLSTGGTIISVIVGPVLINTWFKKRNGLALGVLSAAGSLMGAVAQPVVAHLIEQNGWRAAYFTVGLASIAIVIPVALALLKRSPQAHGVEPLSSEVTFAAAAESVGDGQPRSVEDEGHPRTRRSKRIMRLQDKVAIITGGAGGIGRGISLAFAKEGARLAIVDIDAEAGAKTLAEVSEFTEAVFFDKDIAQVENVNEIVAETIKRFGRLDVLVNNAHASRQALFMDQTQEMFDLSFNTGFYPTVHFMRAGYEALKESQGSVINFASGAGLDGQPTQTSYAAAKEAIRAVSRVTANEWGVDGINVNLISPIALTEGVKAWSVASPDLYEKMLAGIPLRKVGDAEADIGRVAVFLAREDAKYIGDAAVGPDLLRAA